MYRINRNYDSGAVASIGDRAFFDCVSLSGVSIPEAVSSIGTNAFAGCANMTSYSVASGNGHYASSGGCLYNKTMTKLLSCPEGRSSVTIADGTKIIGSHAFYQCQSIRSLTIPASVTTIESNAFADSGISDITIMAGVTSIGSQSGWTADIIYGETNSAAENYANSNSIVFQALNATEPEPTTETEEPGNGNTEIPGNNSGETGNGENGNGGSGAGNGSGTTATKSPGGTAYSSSSGSASTSSSSQKDATPKTGEEMNPIFFFCIAFLLMGCCLLVIGKKKAARQNR